MNVWRRSEAVRKTCFTLSTDRVWAASKQTYYTNSQVLLLVGLQSIHVYLITLLHPTLGSVCVCEYAITANEAEKW
jgi:hypothetical protein